MAYEYVKNTLEQSLKSITMESLLSQSEVADMLILACKYWRKYVTFLSLANEFGVAESTAHDIIVWVENVLIKSGKFGLPGNTVFVDCGSTHDFKMWKKSILKHIYYC